MVVQNGGSATTGGVADRPIAGSLEELEQMVARDLEILLYPQKPWMTPTPAPDGGQALDVAIVGGGHCGIAAAFALLQEKISNILVLDENDPGEEGPWLTYARMPDLRTRKTVIGMEHGYPNLTFRAYFEAREGLAAYAAMPRISCEDWVGYLMWMRKLLNLPVQNASRLKSLAPVGNLLRLTIDHAGREQTLYARRVVLATGPLAMGGANIPPEVDGLPKEYWAHAYERIDVDALAGKRVAVVGGGATAFDNAGELLERGVASVDLLVRRPKLCRVSVIRWTDWAGFLHTFADLPDKERWDMMQMVQRNPAPPTLRALERVDSNPDFRIHFSSPLLSTELAGDGIEIATASGTVAADFLILGTGFSVDLSRCGFLGPILDDIALWRDRLPEAKSGGPEKYRNSPYLGRHYEFCEKLPGAAPYLKHIYNFNQTAQLSMGPTGRVSGLKYGVRRLMDGISGSFLKEDYGRHLASVIAYNDSDMDGHPWVESPEDSRVEQAAE
ncbi:MAG: NAD(P)/FAD-dependent oxidoreductase [Alphaproteobacteria bacterium]|nr:NAD(P)/FAD-dependent oxidoreductase [Alphaproteobacteria bacterium]